METSWLLIFPIVSGLAVAQNPEQLIPTHRQSASIPHKNPYILQFKTKTGALLLYGSQHTSNVDDPQIADIERRWGEFRPTVAYNEGGNPPTLDDVAEALRESEEPGFVRYLAGRDQVPVATLEPPFDREVSYALGLKTYSTLQVKVFYVLRQVAEGHRATDGLSPEQRAAGRLADLPRHGLKEAPNSLEEFGAACKKLFPELEDWRTAPLDWFDPTLTKQYTNDLSDAISWFRDRHIFPLLVERAKRGDRVFAVVGSSHVIALKAALVQVLGKPEFEVNGLR